MNRGRHAYVRLCLFAAIGAFVLSLLIPAVHMQIMGRPGDVYGWQAWLLSLASAGSVFSALNDIQSVPNLILLLAAALNFNFVAVGFWMYRVRQPQALPARLARAALLGLLLALPTPLVFNASRRAGFYVWIAAHCLVLLAAALSWRNERGTLSRNEAASSRSSTPE